jgi:hypothetical protein
MKQENNNIVMYGKLKDKYINPFTDFGFKKLLGEESNKDSVDNLNSYQDLKNSLDYAKQRENKKD